MKEITTTETIQVKRYAAKAGESILLQDSTGEVAVLQTCQKDASITLPATSRLFVGTKEELDQKVKNENLILKQDRIKADAKARLEEARNKKEVKQ